MLPFADSSTLSQAPAAGGLRRFACYATDLSCRNWVCSHADTESLAR